MVLPDDKKKTVKIKVYTKILKTNSFLTLPILHIKKSLSNKLDIRVSNYKSSFYK